MELLIPFYSANNNNIQIHVSGFKTVKTYANIKLEQEGSIKKMRLTFNMQSLNFTTSWVRYGNTDFIINPPLRPIVSLIHDTTAFICVNNSCEILLKSNGSSLSNKNVYLQMEWSY